MAIRVIDGLDSAGSDTGRVKKTVPRRNDPLRPRPRQQQHQNAHVPQPPERQSRSPRIRQAKRRSIAPRQEAIIKSILTRSGCSITSKWKNTEEPHHISALDPSTTIPLASSQRWSVKMKEILLRSLEQQGGEGQEDKHSPVSSPVMPASLAGFVMAHNLARRLKRSALASAAKKLGAPPIAFNRDDDDGEEDDDDDDDEGEGEDPSSTADLHAASIAMIAMRARCQEALTFLHFVKRVREEKREDAAAAAAAGHGWDWVEDNCRCVFDLLASVPAIGSLDLVFRRKILWMLDVVSRRKGQVLFRQGDEQETLWLVLAGRVDVSFKDKQGIVHRAGKYNPGQVLGNLLPEKRLASATCAKQCALLRVDGVTFRQALEDPGAQRVIEKKSFFRSVSLFRGLGERDLDRLAAAFQLTTLEAGDVLCREGDRVDHVYLVQRGNLRLLKAFLPLPPGQAREGSGENAGAEGRSSQGERARARRQQAQQERSQSGTPRPSTGISLSPNSGNAATSVEDDKGGRITGRETRSSRQQQQQQQQQQSSPSAGSSPTKVRHFEIGMAGRKEFIGEGGFTSAAFAGAGALGAAGIEAREGGGGRGGARSGGRRNSRSQGHHRHFSRVGGTYLVSAVAEQRVDVFAAKVSGLLPMQAPAIKLCWIEGSEVHRMKEREWNVGFLASKLQRQDMWESTKRAIVLDNVRTGVLEKRMLVSTAYQAGDVDEGRGS